MTKDEALEELRIMRKEMEKMSQGIPSEWAYSILKKELQRERERSRKLVEQTKEVLQGMVASNGSRYMCMWCDMGGSGRSSLGDQHHDDECPASNLLDALKEYENKGEEKLKS